MGKGRLCSTRVPLHYAEKIFGSPSLLATQPGMGADARLVLQCNLLEVAQRLAELTSTNEVVHALGPTAWLGRVQDDLKSIDQLQQSMQTSIGAFVP